MKTDLAALFLDRQQPMTEEDSEQLLEECNEDLELIEPFVLVSDSISSISCHIGRKEVRALAGARVWNFLHHGLLCFSVSLRGAA